MSKLKVLVLLGIIVLVLLTTYGLKKETPTQPITPEVRPELGYQAPDFTVKDLNGKTVKLSDFRGKPVYINFFASWCPPCLEEMPYLQQFYTQNRDSMVFLAIDITFNDKVEDVKRVMKDKGLTYPVLLDENEKSGPAALYQITGVPEHFFIDKDGVLRDKAIGPMTLQNLQQSLQKAK